MKKTIAVLGLGQFGKAVLKELIENGKDVIAIDNDESKVKSIANLCQACFVADTTNVDALKALGIQDVESAIVAYGTHKEASILTTVILKEMGIKNIIVRADDEFYVPILKQLGATEVVTPAQMAGMSLANRIGNEDIKDFYKLNSQYSIVTIVVTEHFKEEIIADLNPKSKFGVSIVLINRDGKCFVPGGEDLIKANDSIFVVGTNKNISDFTDYINK